MGCRYLGIGAGAGVYALVLGSCVSRRMGKFQLSITEDRCIKNILSILELASCVVCSILIAHRTTQSIKIILAGLEVILPLIHFGWRFFCFTSFAFGPFLFNIFSKKQSEDDNKVDFIGFGIFEGISKLMRFPNQLKGNFS